MASSASCQIPTPNAFDDSVMRYVVKKDPLKCKFVQPELTYVDYEGVLRLNRSAMAAHRIDENLLDCRYSTFRRKPNDDDHVIYDPRKVLNASEKIINGREFVAVTCSYRDKVVYRNYHAYIPRKSGIRLTDQKGIFKPQVFVLVIESMSRLNMIRHMPKTYSYLNDVMKAEELKSLQKSKIGYIRTLAKHFNSCRQFLSNQLKEDAEIKEKYTNLYIKFRNAEGLEANAVYAEIFKMYIKIFGKTRKVAIINSPDLIKFLTMGSDDEYFVSDDVLSTSNVVLMMRKGFPHKNKIDKLLRRLFETGVNIEFSGNTFVESKLKSSNDWRPLSLQDLFGPFTVLIVGYDLSFSCFLAEFLVGMTLNRIAQLI
ncbi:uncharacterized protein LOC111622100 [Centruroides sculpturatus]|uniref:uncharacterized protein LOC111622100 n=1 Tax=Centruroides sculpturatus TaxID=218467 RepID=UPI000C6EDF6E|nr:uncharacterized protein LOC111622100 [Centruroides sculpturatus]